MSNIFINLARNHPLYFRHLIFKKIRFFQRYKKILNKNYKDNMVGLPLVYKLVLTWKCNLKCKMCMLWGDIGWRKNSTIQKNNDLDWEIIENLFLQISRSNPSFILYGGEPLLYKHFKLLAEKLKLNRCFSTICTNGLLLDEFLKEISGNPFLTFMVSLDGLENENDVLRGKGVYRKVISNIKLLKSLKNPPYIGIQFTIRPENISVMYEFCNVMVKLGVDWILLNPCWFITSEQAKKYEYFAMKHFQVLPNSHLGYLLPYNLNPTEFSREYEKIKSVNWPIQISCYFNNPALDMYNYVKSSDFFSNNRLCYKQWIRMDITPDAEVTPCILFPDLSFGNLKDNDIKTLWNSSDYSKFRNLIRKEPLSICNKCNNIYLYDAKRKIL